MAPSGVAKLALAKAPACRPFEACFAGNSLVSRGCVSKWDVSCLTAGGVAGRPGRLMGAAFTSRGGRGGPMHRASRSAGGAGAGGWGSGNGAGTGDGGGGGARTGGTSGTLFNKGTK